jgi:hypothetical protein
LSCNTVESTFLIVVIAVAAVGVLGSVIALLSSRRTWENFGRDGLVMDSELRDARRSGATGGASAGAPLSPAAAAERDAEIRQMLEARNARRRRRGQPEVEVEAELARLTQTPPAASPAIDDELRAEIRDLVVARNLRRARRGEAPLEVEAEVAREVARLGGSSGARNG